MNTMKKIVLLLLPVLLMTGCSAKEEPVDITVFGNSMPAVYTGKVRRKLPHGEGTAVMDHSVSAEGVFEKGTFVSGKTFSVPYSASFGEKNFTGVYTGEVAGTLPAGTGMFDAPDCSYNGTWTEGVPDGTGTLIVPEFTIDTPDGVLSGSYSGDVREGLAEGRGTFVYAADDGKTELDGGFSGNTFDGLLVKTVHYKNTDKSYPVLYEMGNLQDTAAARIAYLEGMRSESYCLSEEQFSYITEHAELFEGKMAAEPSYDEAFTYEGFSEGGSPALIRIEDAVVRSVQRYKPYEGADTVTTMIVQNNDGWYHLVFAYAVDAADTGDVVDICAMPLCRRTLSAPDQEYQAIDAAGAMIIGAPPAGVQYDIG